MKINTFILFLCICYAAGGCKKSNPTEVTPPGGSAGDSITYQMYSSGFHDLRSGEYYVLWAKFTDDSTWVRVGTLKIKFRYSNDSVSINGKITTSKSIDSLRSILITLERAASPVTPGLVLAQCSQLLLDSSSRNRIGNFDPSTTLGDYSSLQGSLVFTSTLPDSTAYIHEFYLMNLHAGKQSPSLLTLIPPAKGWKYGLWAIDSNFTPHQNFLYGLFSSAQGHDSDSSNDHFPYPGGWKPQTMNIPTGYIIVTLEPEFYGDSLKYMQASPFTLLQFKRIRFIEKDSNYRMTNISGDGLPGGRITFVRN